MGVMYSVVFEDIAVTAVQDLFNLLVAANTRVVLHAVYLSQVTEESAEIVQVKIQRATTAGSIGAAVTPAPLDLNAAASQATCRRNDTTQGTSGTVLFVGQWYLPTMFVWEPKPEGRIHVPGLNRIVVELETAPDASTSMSGTLVFEEFA